jgi:sugar phosphate isomerase/epimerase
MTSRRDFLVKSSMLTAGLFVDKSAFFKNKEIGLQLYTVRSEVNNEKLASTIKTIAEAGYKNVELYGYDNRMFFGHTVKDMANILKQNNLKSSSGHYGLADMMHGENYNWDSWKYLLDDAKTLGHKYVIIPYLTTNTVLQTIISDSLTD